MTEKKNLPKNLPESVRARLRKISVESSRPFLEIVQFYAIERFLYRLSESDYSSRLILKGALLFHLWERTEPRPTRDIDFLGHLNNDSDSVLTIIKNILLTTVEPDGLMADLNSIKTEPITENAEYSGIRILFRLLLDKIPVRMQIDIGFGDIVHPGIASGNYPVILGMKSPKLLIYSKESVVAEKFEALVKLGQLNSRMKDFYDLWLISGMFHFDGKTLSEAIFLTCKQRETEIPAIIPAFSDEFIKNKNSQWNAFRRKMRVTTIPESFEVIIVRLKRFWDPVIQPVLSDPSLNCQWHPDGFWDYLRVSLEDNQ